MTFELVQRVTSYYDGWQTRAMDVKLMRQCLACRVRAEFVQRLSSSRGVVELVVGDLVRLLSTSCKGVGLAQ